jgi:hypothetical protein
VLRAALLRFPGIGLLAAGYLAAAKLSLLVAIPPGYVLPLSGERAAAAA